MADRERKSEEKDSNSTSSTRGDPKRKRPEIPSSDLPDEAATKEVEDRSPSRKKTIVAVASEEIERKRKHHEDEGAPGHIQSNNTTKRVFGDMETSPVNGSIKSDTPISPPPKPVFGGFGGGTSKPTGFGDLAGPKTSFGDILGKASSTAIPAPSTTTTTKDNDNTTPMLSTSPARVQMERLEVSSQFSPRSLFPPATPSTKPIPTADDSKEPTTHKSQDDEQQPVVINDSKNTSESEPKPVTEDEHVTSTTTHNNDNSQPPKAGFAVLAEKPPSSSISPPRLGFSTGLLAGRTAEKDASGVFGSGTSGLSAFSSTTTTAGTSSSTTNNTVFGGGAKTGFGGTSSSGGGGGGFSSFSSSLATSGTPSSFQTLLQSSSFVKSSSTTAAAKKRDDDEEDGRGAGSSSKAGAGGDDDDENLEEEEVAVEVDPNAPAANLTPVQVETGEEDEITVFSAKGKLFNFDKTKNDWNERGAGTLHLNQSKRDKNDSRLVMRGEKTLRLMLNIRVVHGVTCKRPGDKFVEFVGIEGADAKSVTRFLVKMTKDNASSLESVLNEKAE
ncbi:hypothetical protein SmJEL517_g01024 [Synchytrium microbalum]|uniref:RanBD1 domain-containing protein n=1 Tax=Synchytrium microbalum TaxID=1806994 RepID=A0A507CG96_9FUNG|nr:uncharacterized protein SmJEL517_g01024 [Synchytrium microbalum]TPX36974.1 hypothetical protein SmJEL517_g01024 [Synchytrium microbalum]